MRCIHEISRRLESVLPLTFIMVVGVWTSSFSQGFSVDGRIGTLGLGAEASVTLQDRVGARIGINALSFSVDGDADDVDYEFEVDLSSITFIADVYLASNGLRVSAGLVANGNEVGLLADIQNDVEIGDSTYSNVDIGNLTGQIEFGDLKPFLGVGIDSSLNKGGGLGFVVEVGALFQGSPLVSLGADGPIGADPQFQMDLEKEQDQIADDVAFFKVYPVIAVGISYHL